MPRSKPVVDNHIEEMKLNACLTLDAWSNIKSEPIVNYMLISDSSTFFLESVSTGEQSHNAKWIAQDMERMVDSISGKIYQYFANTMKQQYEMMNCLSGAERSYLLQLLQSRLDFLYGDAIGIAYLLDPRFVGKKMAAFEKTRVEDLIFGYGSETEQAQQMGKKEEMYLQYTNFVIKVNHNKD
ncbi:hypothetical protein BASA50_002114 [Batrachochytrium salamandrivorans]|uniref:DUF659 domain-containing protein n=1 Tax=Batrachochytrium salamandrivorans TaxID=1357716 RepID=A0ABQ8FQ51_9FUNG|nr:hypothetical protein BASA50_002114 [Batrachochytrium salamandrivorans]